MSKALDRSQRSGSDPIVIGSTKLVTDGNNDLTVQDTSNNRKKILASELHIGDASNVVILKKGSDNKVAFETQASGGSATTSNAGGTSVYADISAMTAVTASAGDQAYVTANKSLYINNGNGWYKISTVNTTPVISAPSNDASITLAKDGTATAIEITATDVDEGTTIQYSYAVTTGSLTNGGGASATITSCATSDGTYASLAASTNTTNRFFKVTPTTNSSYAGTFSITFSASDTISAATTVQNFTLVFFVYGSTVLDGTGDYLSVASFYNLGSADWTIEFWFKCTNFDSNRGICQLGKDNGSLGIMMLTTGKLRLLANYVSSTLNSDTDFSANTWYHVAIVNDDSANTQTMYVNGTAESTTGSRSDAYTFTDTTAIIGGRWYSGGFQLPFLGNISNFRIAASKVYAEPGGFNNGSSAIFDGTNDTVSIAASSDFQLSSGDYTIEWWGYLDSTGGDYKPFFELFYNDTTYYTINYDTVNVRLSILSSGTTIVNTGSNHVMAATTWTHFAFVIDGSSGQATLYVNGTADSSLTNVAGCNIDTTQYKLNLGWREKGGDKFWGGKISNFRWVKGTKVYTSNFTPPTSPLTTISNTKLLTFNDSSAIEDDSSSNHTMTVSGAAANSAGPFVYGFTPSTTPLEAITNTKILTCFNQTGAITDSSSSPLTITAVGNAAASSTHPF